MSTRLFLLDTSVILTLVRGKELAQRIDATYALSRQPLRPLVCIVSHGELRALAEALKWGPAKIQAMRHALDNLTTVDISDDSVLEAYVKVYRAYASHPKGSQANIGENDFWIAAATMATGATLLTTDRHFDYAHPKLLRREYIEPDTPV